MASFKGSEIKGELLKSAAAFRFQDPRFYLETSWFLCVMGEPGAVILLGKVTALFNTEGDKKPKLNEVSQQVEALMKSKLFAFVPEATQSELASFNKAIAGMKLGEIPVLKAKATKAGHFGEHILIYFCM